MSAFGASAPPVTNGTQVSLAQNDCKLQDTGSDGISSLSWSPTANYLVASSWDGGVRMWEVQQQNGVVQAQAKAKTNHEPNSPVLCTAWKSDGSAVFSGGADKAVRMWNPATAGDPNAVAQQIGAHDAGVKAVCFLPNSSLVCSGGWDKKLKFWDQRQPNPAGVLDLPERVYSMDVRGSLMCVATAGRHIICYDVSGPQPREHSRKESPLKYQSRCIACFPDQTGFAVGSIEGRVGIHYVQKVHGKDSFAFKCHRQDTNNVYSVNCIAFNTQFGTFATVGSDGVLNVWDKDNKQRLKGFTAINNTIPCAAFSAQGNLLAYASSYDWSKGSGFYSQGMPNDIYVHYTTEDEIKPKSKKTGIRSR